MQDILYFGYEGYREYTTARKAAAQLPEARVEDASDEIHGLRLGVGCSLPEHIVYPVIH